LCPGAGVIAVKSLRLRLGLPDRFVHPMHAFVAETPGFRRTSLLHWNPAVGERNTVLFHVDGDDPQRYTAALDASASVLDYEVADAEDRPGFYLAVQEAQRDADATLVAPFLGTGVVVVPPVVYRGDRRVDVSVVGSTGALDDALDGLPSGVEMDVVRIRDYTGRVAEPAAELSPRQRDALAAAVELGYYGDPRDASVGDVAERLGCSTGTAAEHLRKAEATVLGRVVDVGPARW
jgi:predicted DNA binding protein